MEKLFIQCIILQHKHPEVQKDLSKSDFFGFTRQYFHLDGCSLTDKNFDRLLFITCNDKNGADFQLIIIHYVLSIMSQ